MQARIADGQTSLAAADLDKAAALMPDNMDVRLQRARLRIGNRDLAGAREDAMAADAGLPLGSNSRLELGRLYGSLDQQEKAIANFYAWPKLHGQDADRAVAYNGRCWARALLNREHDRALSDRNTALKLRPDFAGYLDSRALVQLRLGRLDAALADYDAAIKTNPRSAWSLYARSIAEQRAGKKDASQADRKAALAINPDVVSSGAKYGLES